MIRPTQTGVFNSVENELFSNFAKLVRSQEQVSSGKRILRPSDDPVDATIALSFRRQIARSERYVESIQSGRNLVDGAAASLQDASGHLAEARTILLNGLNGTQSPHDRTLMAGEIRLIREQLLDLANGQMGDRYLFGGTATTSDPFVELTTGGIPRVEYRGDGAGQQALIGQGVRVEITVPGDDVFARLQRSGTQISGLTGVAKGTSVDQGSGFGYLEVRHDATVGALGAGLAFVNGGASDTIIGTHSIDVDPVTGTVTLDGGPPTTIPTPLSAATDVAVTSPGGARLHLDFSGWSGAAFSGTVDGQGSLSLDGTNYVAFNGTETDLEVIDSVTGSVLHVDTRNIGRTGSELVIFGGAVNVFDALEGIAADLENTNGLPDVKLQDRLSMWLDEIDRNHDNLLTATGNLGSRSQRLTSAEDSLEDGLVRVRGLLSSVEDADYAEVVLEMTRAQSNLELTQASSARLFQNSLLNFLR